MSEVALEPLIDPFGNGWRAGASGSQVNSGKSSPASLELDREIGRTSSISAKFHQVTPLLMRQLFARPYCSFSSKPHFLVFFALFLCVICLGLTRALTFNEPLERDQCIYAVAAHEMLAGRPLYSDIWDIKPPAVYLTYAAAEIVAGYGRWQIYLLGMGAATATLLAVYSLIHTLSGNRLAALWTAFFWVLVCSDMGLQANQPNTEVFINAFLVSGLALAARAYRTPNSARCGAWLLGASCLWAVATFFKQVAFLVTLFLALGAGWQPPRAFAASQSRTRRGFFAVCGLVLPSLILWVAVYAYFWATGRNAILHFTLVEYGMVYAREGARVIIAATSFWRRLVPMELFFLWPLVLLWMMGLRATPAGQSLPRFWGALLLYALAVQGAVALPGQYLPHYYQLWLPVVVVGAGLGLSQWHFHAKSIPAQRAVNGSAAAAVALLFATQWPHWNLPMAEYSRQKYDGNDYFVRLPQTARYLDAQLQPGETFYQMGYDAGLYFDTRRRPPVGVLSLGSPHLPSLPLWFQRRIIAQLEREKPEMAVVDSAFPATPVTRYLQKNYVVLPEKVGPEQLILMARRGGALLRRRASLAR